jgi:hypothetical protein
MHPPSMEGDFCVDHGKSVIPATTQDTRDVWTNLTNEQTLTLLADGLGNGHRSYCSIFWNLSIHNSFIILTPCGSKLSQ